MMKKKITAKAFEVISKSKEMMDIFYNKNDLESQLIRLLAHIDSACLESSADFASQEEHIRQTAAEWLYKDDA